MFKKLEWTKGDNCWLSKSPAHTCANYLYRGTFIIYFEEGKYWANWDLSLPGTDTLEELQEVAEKTHQEFFESFLDPVWLDDQSGVDAVLVRLKDDAARALTEKAVKRSYDKWAVYKGDI